MKKCGKMGEGVSESEKKWYFCLSVGMSGKRGEGVGESVDRIDITTKRTGR